MKTLQQLKDEAEKASENFDIACRPFFVNRWDYYRAVECGREIPEAVHKAADDYLAALRAFYNMRDGTRGFLGARGV